MRLSRLCFVPLALSALVGCNEPVPPTPRAAWTVTFQSAGGNCLVMGHNSQVGKVISNKKDLLITDGTDSTKVDCRVTPSGGGFNVNASASRIDLYLNILVDGITKAATEAAPAHGGIAYSSAITADGYVASPTDVPCNYYFIPGSGEGVDAGKIWVAFQCPKVTSEGSTCAIQQGYAIFENCSE